MRTLFVAVLTVVSLVACTQARRAGDAPAAPSEVAQAGLSYDSLVAALRGKSLSIAPLGPIEQSFFSRGARVIRIGESGEAQVYEYQNAQLAASDAKRVKPDGSIGTSMPMWIAPPHFFSSGKLIVLYLGTDGKTLAALGEALGPQFAGR